MIPLYKPYMPKLPKMEQILHSGQLAAGEYTVEFEGMLKKFLGKEQVLSTSTFNTAISVAITTCGIGYGDEVIVSPMACLASTQPYATAGLKIVWADIDPGTGTLCPDAVRKSVTSKTKAIIHNHFCGYPGYIDEINDIGKEKGIVVIDDGIECFGTTYKGKLIGNCGTDVTVFSFNPVRVLTTVDGGAVVFKEEDYDVGKLVRDCGIDRTIFRDDMGEISAECDIKIQGYSATLSNINAYIGVEQFYNLSQRIEKQRKNAARWTATLREYGDFRPLENPNGEPNYWVYGIITADKRECIRYFREKGFYASGVHINNNIYTVFGKQGTLPGVQEFYDSFVALPCGWWMNDEDWDRN
jgi:perosamine synthetase